MISRHRRCEAAEKLKSDKGLEAAEKSEDAILEETERLFSSSLQHHKRMKISYIKQKSMSAASITVEAAFVLPMVILVTFALLYLSFYLHDLNRIHGVIDASLHKAGLLNKPVTDFKSGEITYENLGERGFLYRSEIDKKRGEDQFLCYIRQGLAEGLFLSKVTDIRVQEVDTSWRLEAEVHTAVRMPLLHFLFDRLARRRISEEYPVHNPANALRKYEVILDTASEIKGVEEFKDMVSGLLSKKDRSAPGAR